MITQRFLVCLAVGALAWGAPWRAEAQTPACEYLKVRANTANVSKEPRPDSIFIDLLDKGDIVCVTRNQKAADTDLAYIPFKLSTPGKRAPVDGWVDRAVLQAASPDEVAAATGEAAPQTATENASGHPSTEPSASTPSVQAAGPSSEQASRDDGATSAPQTAKTRESGNPSAGPIASAPAPKAAARGSPDEVLRYSKPIQSAPYPVAGNSIEQLAAGIPIFPPFEGLDKSQWQKNCSNCHKWDRNTLCEQGARYVKNPQLIVRHPHPYGGGFKGALMEWSKSGCQ